MEWNSTYNGYPIANPSNAMRSEASSDTEGGSKTDDNSDTIEGTKPSLKDLSKKEVERAAKENEYKDAHDLKDAYVGKNEGSKFNIKVDTNTGQIYLEGLQNGVQIPTGLYR